MKYITLLICALINWFYATGQTNKKEYYPTGQLKHEGKVLGDLLIGTHKYYFDSGNLKEESYYDDKGLWLGYKEWDNYGNLLRIENYQTEYKDYPIKNFSNITWKKIDDGVSIYKYNHIDTIIQPFNDSSIFSAHYICYLENGKILDNSYSRSNPLYARIDQMFEGFQIGIKQMKPGEVALIKINPKKAFGYKVSGNVPANSVLIYYLNLISLE